MFFLSNKQPFFFFLFIVFLYPQQTISAESKCYDKNIVNVPGQGIFCLTENNDIVEGALRRGGWERHIQAIMHKYINPNKNVIDIGAYVGSHTIHLARSLKRGVVYAFEPQKNIRKKLKINLQLNKINNVRVLPYALGSKEELSYMKKSPHGNKGGTQICSKNNFATSTKCDYKMDKSRPIEIRTLDSFNYSNVNLIKIDAEGHELPILKGAKKTIEKNRPVIILEVFGKTSWGSTEDNKRSVMLYLKKLGYSISHISGADYLAVPTPNE